MQGQIAQIEEQRACVCEMFKAGNSQQAVQELFATAKSRNDQIESLNGTFEALMASKKTYMKERKRFSALKKFMSAEELRLTVDRANQVLSAISELPKITT